MGDGLNDARSVLRTRILRSVDGDTSIEDDQISIEEPLEIAVATESERFSMGVLFRTPGRDEALVLGSLFGEGVIRSRSDVVSMELKTEADATMPATRALVRLAPHVLLDTERHRRVYPISAACGACGKSALEALRIDRSSPFHPTEGLTIGQTELRRLPDRLLKGQSDFHRTGGLHASATFDRDGRLDLLEEDIGRHNALDKLLGACLQNGSLDWSERALVFSGRVGYDLMQKAIVAGCPFVASIGAPSSFAVELANLYKMTLVGFLKERRFNVYSGPHRIHVSEVP